MSSNFPRNPNTGVSRIEYRLSGGTLEDEVIMVFEPPNVYGYTVTLTQWQGFYEDYVESVRSFLDAGMSGSAVTVRRTFVGTAQQDDGNVSL